MRPGGGQEAADSLTPNREGLTRMDFIESIFGVTPDGGSGLLEMLLFLMPLVGIAAFLVRRGRPRDRR